MANYPKNIIKVILIIEIANITINKSKILRKKYLFLKIIKKT